ncbi:leucine--tRNA ligase [Candidatus Woesearchaeota archaeon CG10_big_fil_rev_8_21_14_0_10_32_24]|nr:MAG: leucine--tRNA ligase [Candidatus Woesearchaeota archaeon CG10_big_fil_rev_8_21_14_0_10_32_24]
MTVNWVEIQDKWQKKWADAKLGVATVSDKSKFFMIFAYPGPSGYPHVGHMRGYSYTDMITRYERMQGKEVLFPLGMHASGNLASGFANKIKNKDEQWITYLRTNGCPEETIPTLITPEAVIEYFNEVYVEDYFKKFGFLCDWDRYTCTTWKDYEKFIQWQFLKLQQKDLLVQKPYFATACVVHGPVAVDPSETDISKGGKAEKQEYTLLKFKFGHDYLVAATLRPETIYGQTNLWVNPLVKYVKVEVEGQNWIMSEQAAEKLKYQKDDVILKEGINVKDLIGKTAIAPGIDKEIPIFPASFVDADMGSGIVTCVPSDAPYDYIALKTLEENQTLQSQYGLNVNVKLIPIIESKGYGEFPAQEIVQKMNITSLEDPKLKDATAEIYKVGHHSGIMRANCGIYAGKRVEEAKELVKQDLIKKHKADVFYDLSEEVMCRCGEPVVIKRIDDQWFIKYSNQELTDKTKEHVASMNIYPKEYKENLPGILDWFQDRACVRLGNWQGSKLPFDDKWIVEPIADSTLYPVFYIISKFTKNGTLKVNDLTEEFFDYVFLGEGKGKKAWKPIKEEFDYFYPLDINLGGKEHKTVHFPVFLMNHVGILRKEDWPQGIFINNWVTGKGSKISKSKGGAEPIPQAMEKYGVDAMRLYYAHIGSPHADVVWDEPVVLNYKNQLEKIYGLVEKLNESNGEAKLIDQWLISRMYKHLQQINDSMKEYSLRELASIVYFTIHEDLRWYVRRGGVNKEVIHEVVSMWLRLMNPITPHLSEELNPSKDLISSSSWPQVNESKINPNAEAGEELIKTAMDGMRNVMKLAKLEKPSTFTLFVSDGWRYTLFGILAEKINETRNVGDIMKTVLAHESLKEHGKDVSRIVQSILKDVSRLPYVVTSREEELAVVKEAQNFLSQEFDCIVKISEDLNHEKAKSATPGKVGILVE